MEPNRLYFPPIDVVLVVGKAQEFDIRVDAETAVDVYRCYCNAPCPNFVILDDIQFDGASVMLGSAMDGFALAPQASRESMEMLRAKKDFPPGGLAVEPARACRKDVRVRGRYTGIPIAGLATYDGEYHLNLCFECEARS